MPFKNDAQRRACFAQYYNDIENGIKPRWDCYKWNEETKKSRSLKSVRKSYRSHVKSKKKSRRRKSVQWKSPLKRRRSSKKKKSPKYSSRKY